MSNYDKKYLIINADDFGVNEPTNRAIVELFESKLITSSSLLTVAKNSEQACDLSANQNFSLGVHLTLNSDTADDPWYSNSGAASLGGSSGLWYNQKRLALKAKSSEVTEELEAQYNFMISHGIKPDHADSHCGTLYGINGRLFFINAFKFCKKYSLPFRFPRNPDFLRRQLNGKLPSVLKCIHAKIVSIADKYEVLLPDDIITNPYSIKKIESYDNLRSHYLGELHALKSGISEIFMHPSYPLDSGTEGEWLKREFELRLLQSGDLLVEAKKQNIEICSWGDAPFNEVAGRQNYE
ncbi:MAG TPA: ChbG/HpnK family deacetylase [Oscillospiraceae bacterium]|jgi:hypothetical protein|nr:ChbG/HpnK family deacetylase [Oscillospiraceae bacterium]